ncbi:MAG: hypothetical protein IMY71_13380 [Bacteroidetes bacterium]|nr:hypothetical protein [Bacteroidota bacterium]
MIKNILKYIVIILFLLQSKEVFSQAVQPHAVFKYHDINLLRALITNISTFDAVYIDGVWRINIEFPPQSGIEMLGGGLGPWIGAVVDGDTLLTHGFSWDEGPELWPTDDPRDSIYVSSIDRPVPGSSRFKDDDGDGKIDEELLNGYDDDGDGQIDEDYGSVSQLDYWCQYHDDFQLDCGGTEGHRPLHITVLQKIYGWSYELFEQILFIDYRVISRNDKTLDPLYFGFFFDAHVGPKVYNVWVDDYTYYLPDEKMMVSADAPGGDDGTLEKDQRLGLRVVKVPYYDDVDDPRMKFSFHPFEEDEPPFDADKFISISDGIIDNDESPLDPGNTKCVFGFGPFTVEPGDTMAFTVALVGGFGAEDIKAKAQLAKRLYDNNFEAPPPPPPPLFTLKPGDHSVTINWEWKDEYDQQNYINPEEYADSTRKDGNINDFAGYRIYRSEESTEGPWVLVAEFDKTDDDFGYETGLMYEYKDEGLINGIRYFYAVTAFDLPEKAGVTTIPSQESSKRIHAEMTVPGKKAEKMGGVYVVPNPYRSDIDYTSPIKWEYSTQSGRTDWYEVDRRLAFFNLTGPCTIRIFSLLGECVTVLEHNDTNINVAYWNLISLSNQTVSTGIYFFHVEDYNTGQTQIGKFVIIK